MISLSGIVDFASAAVADWNHYVGLGIWFTLTGVPVPPLQTIVFALFIVLDYQELLGAAQLLKLHPCARLIWRLTSNIGAHIPIDAKIRNYRYHTTAPR